jgi:hypothetical protein
LRHERPQLRIQNFTIVGTWQSYHWNKATAKRELQSTNVVFRNINGQLTESRLSTPPES